MTDAKTHYRTVLGPVFEWAASVDGDPFARAAAWLRQHGLAEGAARCLDLGAGFGAHAVTLASLGKEVTAVECDAHLLQQLRSHASRSGVTVDTRQDDLSKVLHELPVSSYDLVLCVGDTLTHLPAVDLVQELFAETARILTPSGRLAIAFWDTSAMRTTGPRWVAVARTSRRALHCLLEPVNHRILRVTDIVTDVEDGALRTQIGAYPKLRISADDAREWAHAAGLRLLNETVEGGLTTLVFGPRDSAVQSLGGVALRVKDLRRMTRFYRDTFRLRAIHETSAATVFALAPGNGGHTQTLMLSQRGAEGDAANGTLDHVALAIDRSQYEPERGRLISLGLQVETAYHDWASWRSLYVRDPEGNRVELVCFDPNW